MARGARVTVELEDRVVSDQPEGPEWWVASDGKWYPPDEAPAVPPADTWASPPPGPPTPTAMSGGAKGPVIAGLVVVGLLVVIGLAVLFVRSSSDSTGSDGETEATVELPEGYHLVEGEGVSIGAPESWEGMSPEDAEMSADDLEQAFPEVADEMLERGADAVNRGSVLVAFDPESSSFDNVNILELPTRIELSSMEQQATMELTSVGAEIESIEEASVPAGDALRAEYTVDVARPDGSTAPTQGVQYYVVTDDRSYVVTFSSGSDIGELATAMIDTFRVD